MTLISADEAEPIHSAILRKEAWTQDAARRLRAEADKRVKDGPWSVTAERPKGVDIDEHDYYSEAPYWWPNPDNPDGPYIRKDGRTNPDRFIANKNALDAMCDAVFTLGTAAYFLDDVNYARRAARIVNAWFVSPRTRMNPNLDYSQAVRGISEGRGEGVIDSRVFIRAVQGIEFLALTGAWDARDQAAVHRWFEEYLRWLTRSDNGLEAKHSGNNHASWWTAQAAAIAVFVDDKPTAQAAFNYYRDTILPGQIRANGSAPREEERTRSLSYSVFNAEALAMTCRIAQVQGVDLWSARTRNGATLSTIINYLLPYINDPRKWTKQQISEFQTDGLYFLAFAAMGLKQPDYLAVYHKLERPVGAWLSFVDLIAGRWEAAAHQTRH
jgi:hypothetical protein